MNINSFSQSSASLSSEKSSAQGSPLDNLMGIMPDAGGENPKFSLNNMLPAFNGNGESNIAGEVLDNASDVLADNNTPAIPTDPALGQGSVNDVTQLLNYLLKGEAAGEVRMGAKAGEDNIQNRGLSATMAVATQPQVALATTLNDETAGSAKIQAPVIAQSGANSGTADMPTLMSAASQVLNVRGELMDAAPVSMLRTLLDKAEGNTPVPSSLTLPITGMTSVQEGTGNSINTTERPANWSTVKLDANQQQWSQQLHSVLNDRLQIQTDNRIQHATIRLDPPDMGKIDISLHMDGGKLQVQINASQNDVYKALQHISQELRINLTEQNFTQVSVQVTSNGQQQNQGQNRHMNGQQPEPEIAKQNEQGELTKHIDDTILTTA